MTFRRHSNACLAAVAVAALVTAWCGPANAQQKKAVPVKADAIGGQVTGPGGEDVVQGTDGDHIFFHGWLNGGTAGPAS